MRLKTIHRLKFSTCIIAYFSLILLSGLEMKAKVIRE